jgi:quercetin dioxygenase-like cupin family protein
MKQSAIALWLVIATVLLPPAGSAFAQSDASSLFQNEKRFSAETPPMDAEIVQLILDFQPGVWLPLHIHDGPGYATVIDGAMTRRAQGAAELIVPKGEGWIDSADIPHQAGNDGAIPARIVATFVIPRGATLTTLLEPATGPGATTFAEYRFETQMLPSPMDLVHRVADVAPGTRVPLNGPAGPMLVNVLQGTGTVMNGASSNPVTPGAVWLERTESAPGSFLLATSPMKLVATHLIPRGASLTLPAGPRAPVQMPAPATIR